MTTILEAPCKICRGTGTTYLEHTDGSLSEEVCPYCKGRKNSTWLRERYNGRLNRLAFYKGWVWLACIVLGVTFTLPVWTASTDLKVIHFVMFIVLAIALIWVWIHPEPKKKVKKPNPLTTDREKLMGGAVLGGALLKHELEQRFPRRR